MAVFVKNVNLTNIIPKHVGARLLLVERIVLWPRYFRRTKMIAMGGWGQRTDGALSENVIRSTTVGRSPSEI